VTVLGQIIDGDALLGVIVASVVAGGGLTIAFSTLIVCATRAAELRRRGNAVWATALTVIAVAAVLVCLGLVVFGLRVMVED
jgi:hypothetical protein